MTSLVAPNIEASTMALISGTFIWSYEVGAKISCSIYCIIFDVNNEHMSNYQNVLLAKIPMIFFIMIFTLMIPLNENIHSLAKKLRQEHLNNLRKIEN